MTSYIEFLNLNRDYAVGVGGTNLGPPSGVYSLKVDPDKVGWRYEVFKRSDSDGSLLTPTPNEGVVPVRSGYIATPDGPVAGRPIRLNLHADYLDPFDGDGYFAVITEPADEEEGE